MNKHKKRAQAPKRSTRHDNNTDKSHVRVGAMQKSPRYNRRKDGAW
jgi:hypothetical protein